MFASFKSVSPVSLDMHWFCGVSGTTEAGGCVYISSVSVWDVINTLPGHTASTTTVELSFSTTTVLRALAVSPRSMSAMESSPWFSDIIFITRLRIMSCAPFWSASLAEDPAPNKRSNCSKRNCSRCEGVFEIVGRFLTWLVHSGGYNLQLWLSLYFAFSFPP